ncbi:transmembrane protein 35B-like [Glandiceps talaboti]
MGVLRTVIGSIFVLAGVAKLVPIGPQYNYEVQEFAAYSTVFPFGYKPDPAMFQLIIGIMETIGGVPILCGSDKFDKLSEVVLLQLGVMVLATSMLYRLNAPISKTAVPAAIGLGLIYLLVQNQDKPKLE